MTNPLNVTNLVRYVPCPRCLSVPGEPCWTSSGSVLDNAPHREREKATAALLAEAVSSYLKKATAT